MKKLSLLNIVGLFFVLIFFSSANFSSNAQADEININNDSGNLLKGKPQTVESVKEEKMDKNNLETAYLGAGCFWCVEAIFQKLKGVISVEPGYSGGTVPNPTYEAVCTGKTGHAEVAKIVFDSTKISFKKLLEVFFEIHDPTTLNRQGNDVGEQYRSVIFYVDENQKKIAENLKGRLDKSGIYESPIVTEITPLNKFYPAEDYHKNYYETHKDQPYCQFVISPKVKKFEKKFSDFLNVK